MGKQYAILRVQKCKGAAIGAMQYHNDRVPGQHSNEDIDYGKSNLNKEYIEHGSYRAEVQQMRKSGKQLESERSSGRPESRSKGVDR